jgi:nicotinamidase-related amidase
MTAPSRLDRTHAVLLVIDIQERLIAAMPPAIAEQTVKNTAILIEAAARFGMPVVCSEQYPRGLGKTVAAVEVALAAAAAGGGSGGGGGGGAGRVHRIEKLEFSLAPHLLPLALPDAPQWIVTGMEAHVCVYQTARDLLSGGGAVHVVADAVCSRTEANWRIGIDRLRDEDATITSTETTVFDLLGRAGTDEFKALSKLIK